MYFVLQGPGCIYAAELDEGHVSPEVGEVLVSQEIPVRKRVRLQVSF